MQRVSMGRSSHRVTSSLRSPPTCGCSARPIAAAGSSTTLVYWASRTLPQNGRAQWLNRKPLGNGGGLASLGNKMLPLCRPPTAKTGKPHACVDTKPNYDRLPPPDVAARQQQELRGAQLAEACLAERFSISQRALRSA